VNAGIVQLFPGARTFALIHIENYVVEFLKILVETRHRNALGSSCGCRCHRLRRTFCPTCIPVPALCFSKSRASRIL